MKTGLILEGGAMRAIFTAGVIDVLMEHGIDFNGAVGVSAGAAFGCNYKSRQIGRVIRYNTRFSRDKRYGGFQVLLKEGNYYSKDFCYNELPLQHDIFDFDTYESNPMEFYVVCTDVDTGKAEYHRFDDRHDHGFEWIRASASMPLVSRMVDIDGRKYLDGALADSIPVKYFESIGYDRNVVVLTQPRGFRKQPDKLLFLMKQYYRKYPNLVSSMVTRHEQYNTSLDYISGRKLQEIFSSFVPRKSFPSAAPKKIRTSCGRFMRSDGEPFPKGSRISGSSCQQTICNFPLSQQKYTQQLDLPKSNRCVYCVYFTFYSTAFSDSVIGIL